MYEDLLAAAINATAETMKLSAQATRYYELACTDLDDVAAYVAAYENDDRLPHEHDKAMGCFDHLTWARCA